MSTSFYETYTVRELAELLQHSTSERERLARENERLAANGRLVVAHLRRVIELSNAPPASPLAMAIADAEELIESEPRGAEVLS